MVVAIFELLRFLNVGFRFEVSKTRKDILPPFSHKGNDGIFVATLDDIFDVLSVV